METNKVVEETKEMEPESETNSRNKRIFSDASSEISLNTQKSSSEQSLNPSSYLQFVNNTNKKRRKLLDNFHHESFYRVKKHKNTKKERSLSPSSSLSSLSSESMSGLPFSETEDDSSTATRSTVGSATKQKSYNDDEVIECCSQSLVFASKNDKFLQQKSCSEKKIREKNRLHAVNLFGPSLSDKKLVVQSQPQQRLVPKEKEAKTDATRRSSFSLDHIKSPIVQKNSKLIDDLLINKEMEEEKNNKKKGRKRLFDANSYDYIDKAFDDVPDVQLEITVPLLKKTIHDNSTTKSNETSIPICGQKQPSVATSFENMTSNSSNLIDQDTYLTVTTQDSLFLGIF